MFLSRVWSRLYARLIGLPIGVRAPGKDGRFDCLRHR